MRNVTHRLNSSKPVAVFSDSLSAIRTVESERSRSRPNLLNDILELKHALQRDLTLVWVPSHIGIRGNETAVGWQTRRRRSPPLTLTSATNWQKPTVLLTITAETNGKRSGPSRPTTSIH